MIVVLQRARRARVTVGVEEIASIGRGLVLLVGVAEGDTEVEAAWLAKKVAYLRVFEDKDGKTNLDLHDVDGEALVVSQFTLLADVNKGRRPSFVHAARPERAEPLVEAFADGLRRAGLPVALGQFGAHMVIELENDGPLTIVLERNP
ncbi:MAG: D-aminoacyl-tRNA deacylase [Anaerolineales bacterium]